MLDSEIRSSTRALVVFNNGQVKEEDYRGIFPYSGLTPDTRRWLEMVAYFFKNDWVLRLKPHPSYALNNDKVAEASLITPQGFRVSGLVLAGRINGVDLSIEEDTGWRIDLNTYSLYRLVLPSRFVAEDLAQGQFSVYRSR